jgi:hypothetical protein
MVWKKGRKRRRWKGGVRRAPPSSDPHLALSKLGKIRKKGKTLAGRGERERDEALQKKSQTSHKARGTSGSI